MSQDVWVVAWSECFRAVLPVVAGLLDRIAASADNWKSRYHACMRYCMCRKSYPVRSPGGGYKERSTLLKGPEAQLSCCDHVRVEAARDA